MGQIGSNTAVTSLEVQANASYSNHVQYVDLVDLTRTISSKLAVQSLERGRQAGDSPDQEQPRREKMHDIARHTFGLGGGTEAADRSSAHAAGAGPRLHLDCRAACNKRTYFKTFMATR